MDLSDKDQTTGLYLADMPTKKRKEPEEPHEDLRSVISSNQSSKPSGEYGRDNVQLIVEGYSPITIHKQTLRDASEYFATLLKYNEDQIHMTPPPNVQPDRYVSLLRSVSNNQPPAVDECNMWDYLVLARYFLIKPLEDTCSRVIRQALPTLAMDELCRLWCNARAEQCDDETKWFLAGIVRNFDQAGQSMEFLNLGFEEMLVLLRDDEFLPLFEKHVYKAIISWCYHNPEQRMIETIVDVLLAEIVWDQFDSDAIRQLAVGTTPPLQSILENISTNAAGRKKPKRAVERHLIFGHEAFVQRKRDKRRTRELLHFDCLRGTLRVWQAPAARALCTKGSWQYLTHDLNVSHPTVIFRMKSDWMGRATGNEINMVAVVNLVNGNARMIGNGLSGGHFMHFMEMVMGGYDVCLNWCYQKYTGFLRFGLCKWEIEPAPFQCEDLQGVATCLLQLPEGERIAHLLSFVRRDESYKVIPDSVIGFCDKRSKDFFSAFERLPALPSPRHGAAIIQCGTFLFVTGGCDMPNDNVDVAKQCYRLNLTARVHWERIGDLSLPRVDHCMFVKSGRVFVYGGSTLDADKKKVALLSFETYDTYADIWTMFNIPLTGGGRREMGGGSIGDSDQTTYCVDLGSSLDETKYRDVDDPIY